MERMNAERDLPLVGVSSSMPDMTATRTVIGSSDASSEPRNTFAPLQWVSPKHPVFLLAYFTHQGLNLVGVRRPLDSQPDP